MATRSRWGKTPRTSVQEQIERRGRSEVVAGCIRLLDGSSADDVDADLVLALGGPPARWVVTGQPSGPDYWLRVWAARGLLWCWDDEAYPAVVHALTDESWRVREMALRVIARHALVDATAQVAGRQQDPSTRVRRTAERALQRLAHLDP